MEGGKTRSLDAEVAGLDLEKISGGPVEPFAFMVVAQTP